MSKKMEMEHTRRAFLKKLGLGIAAVGSAGLVGRVASAAPLDANISGRGLLDRVSSPANALVLQERGDAFFYLQAQGLPDHITGNFPNQSCPFPILARSENVVDPLKISKNPKANPKATDIGNWIFGVAVNGVVFDPGGPYWKGNVDSGWHFEVLTLARPYLGIDFNNAHSQQGGEYHYHGIPQGLLLRLQQEQALRNEKPKMILLGWAADGFPIYAPFAHRNPRDPSSALVEMRASYQQKTGARGAGSPGGRHDTAIFVQDFEYRAGTGNLDECNGRFGVTPEFPQGIYHYFVTNAFPFVPRHWRGTPDGSFYHPTPDLAAVPKALQELDFQKI